VDLNQLLHRHQLSLMQLDQAESSEERRAHREFASDYAEKIQIARDVLGAPAPHRTSSVDIAIENELSDNQVKVTGCVTARVVLIASEDLQYAVVVSRDGEESSRRSFRTMREAETEIRQDHANSGAPFNSL
jgi:hypothetical protein